MNVSTIETSNNKDAIYNELAKGYSITKCAEHLANLSVSRIKRIIISDARLSHMWYNNMMLNRVRGYNV